MKKVSLQSQNLKKKKRLNFNKTTPVMKSTNKPLNMSKLRNLKFLNEIIVCNVAMTVRFIDQKYQKTSKTLMYQLNSSDESIGSA